jgi:hypothetical protein
VEAFGFVTSVHPHFVDNRVIDADEVLRYSAGLALPSGIFFVLIGVKRAESTPGS